MLYRKLLLCITSFILGVSLCGCSRQEKDVSVTVGNKKYTAFVDVEKGSITTDDGEMYTYLEDGSKVIFTYPDDSEWSVEESGNTAVMEECNIDEEKYLEGDILWEIYKEGNQSSEFPIIQIAFSVIGGLMIVYPKFFWFIKYGWMLRDVEISKTGLLLIRLIGCLLIIGMFFFL